MTYPQPPDVFDAPTIHFCDAFGDKNCWHTVDSEGETCDQCLVENAEACGDWDAESFAALGRSGRDGRRSTAFNLPRKASEGFPALRPNAPSHNPEQP